MSAAHLAQVDERRRLRHRRVVLEETHAQRPGAVVRDLRHERGANGGANGGANRVRTRCEQGENTVQAECIITRWSLSSLTQD